jgi:hypothetical protein
MAATVLTRDPVFGWFAYGANLSVETNSLSMIPRDGLRQRFHAVIGDPPGASAKPMRLKLELERDGFAAGEKIVATPSLDRVAFTLENRTGDEHATGLRLSLPEGATFSVLQDGTTRELQKTSNADYPWRVEFKITPGPTRIELVRKR